MPRIALLLSGLCLLLTNSCESLRGTADSPTHFASAWRTCHDRVWIGPEFWANRLRDWQVQSGRVECISTRLPMRTLHLLSWRADQPNGEMEVRVRVGRLATDGELPDDCAVGILVGAGAADLDYRAAALVQSGPGPDGGYFVGIDGTGALFVRDFSVDDLEEHPKARVAQQVGAQVLSDVELRCIVAPAGGVCRLQVSAVDPESGVVLAAVGMDRIPAERLLGNLALVSHPGPRRGGATFWFQDWQAEGDMLAVHPERSAGPVLASQYTLSRGVLKMTAQMMPIGNDDHQRVWLQTNATGPWEAIAEAEIEAPGYTATFRVPNWPAHKAVPYRLAYQLRDRDGGYRVTGWEGVVRADPVDQRRVTVAAMTGTHQVRFGFGRPGFPWNESALWFPHGDLIEHLRRREPDLLFFSGDQVYEGASPTPAERGEHAELDYLYKWYLWCWAFRDLTRDHPAVTIPDDHDVFQGNLWGAGGRATERDHNGGYVMPASWVRMVERTQTSHLPDPFDPTPIEQGIGVYYTDLLCGKVSFAVLEDRKFKSGPKGRVEHGGPRPDHIVDASFSPASADVVGATLLGERQLEFLDHWARDWRGVEMKATLSQTVFANVATHHGGRQDPLVADLDSNGWPQSGRNAALGAIRKAFAVMLCGDQHLATLVRHGIDTWGDAGYSLCVPSVANFYLRAWRPGMPGENHVAGMPDYTGDYRDGLGNHVTVLAATNPEGALGREPAALHDNKPGYGVAVFDKYERTIAFECWPRWADPRSDGPEAQYPGWPVTVDQTDNYGREAVAWLPTLQFERMREPVVMVEDADGELVYALRISGRVFRPKVFAAGTYRVTVGEPGTEAMEVLELEATVDGRGAVRIEL